MSITALFENSLTITRFSVFYWHEYFFEDTLDSKHKYWISLNCKVNDFPINIILPTSQYDKHYYTNPVNRIDCVVIKKGESKYFHTEETILDLKNIIKEDRDKVLEAFDNEFLVYQGELEDFLCKRIEDTIRSSSLLEEYLIAEYLCEEV